MIGSTEMFLAAVPALLFLLAPLFVAIGPRSEGLLDSIGRTVLAVAAVRAFLTGAQRPSKVIFCTFDANATEVVTAALAAID